MIHPFPFEHPAHAHMELFDGDQWRFKFSNGYSASVVRHRYSYGFDCGLWEMAVLNDLDDIIDNPVTGDDVIGYMSEKDIAILLDKLCRLTPNTGDKQ